MIGKVDEPYVKNPQPKLKYKKFLRSSRAADGPKARELYKLYRNGNLNSGPTPELLDRFNIPGCPHGRPSDVMCPHCHPEAPSASRPPIPEG